MRETGEVGQQPKKLFCASGSKIIISQIKLQMSEVGHAAKWKEQHFSTIVCYFVVW